MRYGDREPRGGIGVAPDALRDAIATIRATLPGVEAGVSAAACSRPPAARSRRPRGDHGAARGVGRSRGRSGRGSRSSPGSQRTRTTSARAWPAATNASLSRSPHELGSILHLSSPVERIAWGDGTAALSAPAGPRPRSTESSSLCRRASSAGSSSSRRSRIRCAPRTTQSSTGTPPSSSSRSARDAPRARCSRYPSATGAGRRRPPTASSPSSTRSPARLPRSSDFTSSTEPDAWLESLRRLRPDLALSTDGVVLSTWDDDPWVGAAYSCAAPGVDGVGAVRPVPRLRRAHARVEPSADGRGARERAACCARGVGRKVRSRPQILTVRSNTLEVVP